MIDMTNIRLTNEEISAAKMGGFNLRRLIGDVLGKAKAAEYEARGIVMEKVTARKFCAVRSWCDAVHEAIKPKRGAAVKVVGIEGKFCLSMGNFEIVTVADADGNQWSIGNKYDTTVAFWRMSEEELITYVNAQG